MKLKASEADFIQFRDDSSYVLGKDENGGSYRYTLYMYREKDHFEVEFGTSADFDYCPVYGLFKSCNECESHHEDCCTAKPVVLTTEEVQDYLDSCDDLFYVHRYFGRDKECPKQP
jgi:hypothetical protein